MSIYLTRQVAPLRRDEGGQMAIAVVLALPVVDRALMEVLSCLSQVQDNPQAEAGSSKRIDQAKRIIVQELDTRRRKAENQQN